MLNLCKLVLRVVLQIRRRNRDNLGIKVFIFSPNHVENPSLEPSQFTEMVLMRGHNICCHGELKKNLRIILKSPYLEL